MVAMERKRADVAAGKTSPEGGLQLTESPAHWGQGENGGENDVALRCPQMQNSSGAEADPG